MASKGQKFKKYTPELKNKILEEYFSGKESPRSLSPKYDVPVEAVRTWIKKTKNIDVKVDHRPGRSGRAKEKNLTLEDYKERYEILKKIPGLLTSVAREKVTFITIHINEYK